MTWALLLPSWAFGALLLGAALTSLALEIRRSRRRRARAADLRHALTLLRDAATAGTPPREVWPLAATHSPLAPELHRLGGLLQQPERIALRALDRGVLRPDLDPLARAGIIGTHRGVPLAPILDALLRDADARQEHADRTAAALAGARMTILLLTLLPLLILLGGHLSGLGSARILFTSPMGVPALLLGSALTAAGVWWADHLSRRTMDPATSDHELAAARAVDLLAACADAGLPEAACWQVSLGQAIRDPPESWSAVGPLLWLGAGPQAFAPLRADPALGSLASLAEFHLSVGSSLAPSVRDHAQRIRASVRSASTATAESLLVVMAAPLALCFLPAFILLGLVPSALGLAGF